MKKGIKKAHPLATKLVDEPNHKRPIHGFCYIHFNMDKDKKTKLYLQVKQINYINSLFDEPLLIMDKDNLTFEPVNEKRFHEWLKNLHRGGEQ